MPQVAGEWALTGRDGELEHLTALVRTGDRRGVVIAGPAGVGKTRLAQECLAEAAQAGLATARVTATRSATHLPFGALAPLLPPAEAIGIAEDRGEFLRRCSATLVERAEGGRLVLLVDDAHLLDDASATLVQLLATTASAFVVATIRTGQPGSDPVTSLWKDGLVERIDLAGLAPDAIEELLGTALGGPVDRAAVARLAARCRGNVLFLRELVLGAVASGALRHESGLWRLAGPLSPSDRLVELVEARLADLGDAERSLLELVAMGEPLGAAELTALSDPDVADSLERRAILESGVDGRRLELRLGHPLYGEVLRARLPALRLRTLSRNLADAVEAAGARRREDLLRVAGWRLDGGGPVRADLMLAAARQARARWDLVLAERLGQAAVDAGAGFDAGLLIGQVASLQAQGEKAEDRFAALVSQAADDSQRSILATVRMDNLVWGLGRTADAIGVAEEAEANISEPALRDDVTAKRGAWLQVSGRTTRAVEVLEPLLPQAEGRTLVNVCQHLTIPLAFSGRVAAALEVSARGEAAHAELEGTPMVFGPWVHPALAALALTAGGYLIEAEQRGRAGYRRAVNDGSAEAQGLFSLVLAFTLLDRGRVMEAERLGRESATVYRQMGWRSLQRMALVPLVSALAFSGRAKEARAALTELHALKLPDPEWPGPLLLRARAWTEVAAGDLCAARQHLEEAVALARENGDRVFESAALHDLARLGHSEQAVSRLVELAGQIEGDLAPARAGHAGALTTGDASALEDASSAFEALGADLLAAEAAADAALSWRRGGDTRRAVAAERRSWSLSARCEGATTPALRAVDTQVMLSRAEWEVAALAAAGRSNKDIAGQLHLSLRTVENYLHRAYEKLGISSRAELGAALHD